MRNITLEPLDVWDKDMVVFVYRTRCHKEVSRCLFGLPPANLKAHWDWLVENVPSKRLMYILKCDGKPAGYCHAYNFENNHGHIEVGFAIHPDFQGQGLAHVMVEKLVERISKIMPDRCVQLYVQADNHRAVSLYQKHGFEMIGYMDNVVAMERRNGSGKYNKEGCVCL